VVLLGLTRHRGEFSTSSRHNDFRKGKLTSGSIAG
jgi:hypothetical protein